MVNFLLAPWVSSPTSPMSFRLPIAFSLAAVTLASLLEVGQVSFRASNQNLAAVYSDRQAIEGVALTRSVNTQPGGKFIQSAMGIAHQVFAVIADKLVSNKIKRRRHMAASVDISMKGASFVH